MTEATGTLVSAAVLTPVGRGAVATIRLRGELDQLTKSVERYFHAASGRTLQQQRVGQIAFGAWGAGTEQEDVVVGRVENHVVEIHCHGGDAAARRILVDLEQAGCQVTDWRAQVFDELDALQSECADRLSRASTWRTADILHEQSSGVLRRAIQSVEGCLNRSRETNCAAEALEQLDELLKWSSFGCHLSEPWKIVLTGRPNVGKSSLINALLGYQRAIVFDTPGTTRDVVTAETAFDGWPVVLADTAGLRDTTEELEAAGIELARRQLQNADARLVLVDLSQPPTRDDQALLEEWPDAIVVGHKCDLNDQWQSHLPGDAVRVSSVTGTGLETIRQHLVEHVVPAVPSQGTAVPVTARQCQWLEQAREAVVAGDKVAARVALGKLFVDDIEIERATGRL